jgi:hypothetical protein
MPVIAVIAGRLSSRRFSSVWSPFLEQAEQAELLGYRDRAVQALAGHRRILHARAARQPRRRQAASSS